MSKIDHIYTSAPDDHVIGDKSAQNEVIVYASVTCPHCADWFKNEWPKFKAAEVDSGQTKFVFREFPTAPAQLAMAEFYLANAAPEDQFLDQILYQYEHQRDIVTDYENGQSKQVLEKIGHKAGLDTDADIKNSLSDEKTRVHLHTTMDRAEAGHVRGTPSFIIGQKLYNGRSNSAAALILASETARA